MNFIFVLCLAGFASSISWRAVDPMLPVMAADLEVSLSQAALLSSAYSFPFSFMQLVLGPLGDAIGKGRLIRICLAILGVSLALTAIAPSYGTVLAARVVAGAFSGGISPVSLALIGDRTSLADRQVAIGRFLVAAIFGQVFGAAASGMLVGLIGWRLVFVLASLFAAAAWLTTLLFLGGESERRTRLTLSRIISGYATVLGNPLSFFVFGTVAAEGALVLGLLPFVAPLLLARGAGGPFEAGIVIAGFAAGGVLYGLAVRRVVKAIDQWQMMRLGGLMIGIALMTSAAPLPWPGMAALFLIGGFGFYMMHNIMQTQATELAPAVRGSTFALFAFSFFLGQGLGPVIGGAVSRAAGFSALFFAAGALVATGLAIGAARIFARRGKI